MGKLSKLFENNFHHKINPCVLFLIKHSSIEKVDRPVVKPPPLATQPEKKIFGFVKRRKEDKTKNIPIDSPSKDANNSDSNSAYESTEQNVVGSSDNESVLCNKQTIQEKIKTLGLDFFSEDFEGITASSIQCLECETTTEQRETMIDLSVPITDNMEMHETNETFIQVS